MYLLLNSTLPPPTLAPQDKELLTTVPSNQETFRKEKINTQIY
jgi:hypothetical protein